MQFRLCEMVGCPHPDYLPPLTLPQLLDWQTYSLKHGHRSDIQLGLIACLIAAQYGKVKLEDFLPYQELDPPTDDEIADSIMEFFKVPDVPHSDKSGTSGTR